jgi:hypothetical protein
VTASGPDDRLRARSAIDRRKPAQQHSHAERGTEDGDQLPASLPAITAMGACMPLRFPDQHRDMRDGRYEHHRRDRQPARPGCE